MATILLLNADNRVISYRTGPYVESEAVGDEVFLPGDVPDNILFTLFTAPDTFTSDSTTASMRLPSVEELKTRLKARNLAKRLSMQAAGVAYTFPDGTGTVQTRNDTDIASINAVATAGIALAGQGVTDPVLKFRDTENVTHPLTPAQAVTFGLAVTDAISALYETKWTVDEQIDALTTVAECEAFDVDAEWT